MTCEDTDRQCSLCGVYGCADEIDDDSMCVDADSCARRAESDREFD